MILFPASIDQIREHKANRNEGPVPLAAPPFIGKSKDYLTVPLFVLRIFHPIWVELS